MVRDGYYWMFYALYQIDPFRSDPFDKRWKTLVFISIVMMCAIASLLYFVGLVAGSGFVFAIPRSAAVGGMTVIMGLNYVATLHGNRWQRYAARFDALPRRARRNALLWAWVVAASAVVAFAVTSYAYRGSAAGVSARERAIEARERARPR